MAHHHPSFEPLLKSGQYLTLLWLQSDAAAAVQNVRRAVAASPHLEDEVCALLDQVNWRPQLVGAAALPLGATTPRTVASLWGALDAGSWVAPQLAVIASLVDSDFETRARERITSKCPIYTERIRSLSWAERHSAAGPSSIAGHSAKLFASLVGLVETQPRAPSWLAQQLAQDESQKLLSEDQNQDKARIIVGIWLKAWAAASAP